MESKSGDVYVIYNKLNHKVLIGEGGDGISRLSQHRSNLKKGNERNKPLQEDYNRNGEDAFEFEVIINTSEHELCELVLIEIFSRVGMAYNERKNNKYKEVASGDTTIHNNLYKIIEDFIQEWQFKLPYYKELLIELENIRKNGFECKSEKLYQREYKNTYLSSKYDDETIRATKQLFINSYNFEKKMNKDLYDFTHQEAEEFLYSLKIKTPDSVRNIISKLSNYLDYSIKQGVSNNKINYYEELRKDKSKFVDKEAEENMIFDRDEIMEMALNADNAQDGVILALLFDGVSHKNEFEELIELTKDDIDFDNKEIRLKDRTIPMRHETKILVEDALDQDRKYVSIKGEKARTYTVTRGINVLRGLRGKAKVKAQIISQRILRIADIYGYPYLNATTISYSGQINYAKELINEQNFSVDETLPLILLRFGIPDNPNSRHYLKKRILKYLGDKDNSEE